MVDLEHIRPGFLKWHLNRQGERPWPFRPVLHHFTEPDGDDPHDHPWAFRTTILRGSYVADEYQLLPHGQWLKSRRTYSEGETHQFDAEHIHRIIELPEGECWTLVIAEPKCREWRFWRFDHVAESRPWDQPEF